MRNSKKQHKNLPQNQQQHKKHADSIGKSMLFGVENHPSEKFVKWFVNEEMGKFVRFVEMLDGVDLLGGKVVHLSFDCPKNLRDYFNKVAKRKVGSSCKLLRSFMLKTIAQHVLEKHALGNTLSDVVPAVFHVPNIVMPTYVQSRPRRYVRGSVVREVDVDEGEGVKCVFCGRSAVGFYQHLSRGEVVPLCEFHSEHLRLNYRFVRWVE